METDAGSQLALETFPRASPPFLAHQFFPGARSLDNMNGGRHASISSRGPCVDSSPTSHRLGPLEQGPYNGQRMDWDVKQWEWDSVLFLAQPSSSPAAITDRTKNFYQGTQNGHTDRTEPTEANGVGLRLDGGVSSSPDQNGSSDHDDPHTSHRGKHPASDEENWHPSHSGKAQPFLRDGSSPEEDGESLSLKLGGHSYAYSDEGGIASRDAKRYRSSSPGPQFPSCQVDDCKADLSTAKDYHRRHKVCEMHAKAVKALVSRLMQRFCQQCSRFHPLTEFDEGKRSCRRRLAGHNRRRRKNQPDPPPCRGFAGLDENGSGNALGVMGFLNILSSLQAVSSAGALNGIINERDALLQYLRKGALSPPAGLDNLTTASIANLLNMTGGLESGRPDLKPQSFPTNVQNPSSVGEAEAFLSALGAPKTNEALALLLQNNLRGQLTSALMKAGETPLVQVGQSNRNSTLPAATPSAAVPSRVTSAGPSVSHAPVMAARPLALHNFASPSRPNSVHQQVMGENSVQRVDQSQGKFRQGQVTPVATVQKLFPQVQASESRSSGQYGIHVEDDRVTESTSDLDPPGSMMSLLEGQDARTLQDVVSHHSRPAIDLQQPALQYDMNESSPSGSDQSPSSSYADWQDRTGRISIKLFDRNPGELPQLLRAQILEWLAHRPSNMESYIRPGCTVLTVFLSMPTMAWIELERDLRISLPKLIGNGEFWSLGRIHLQVDRRNAYVVDGKIYVSKPLKSVTAPQLLSVRPFAVVAGQRTNIVLRGRNLRRSGARIFSAYQGKYSAKEVLSAEGQQGLGRSSMNSVDEIGYDEFSISFDGGCPDVMGRAFIEVEKQMGGGSALPVIVADGPICAELQMLEENVTQFSNDGGKMPHSDDFVPHSLVADFLNELGWLFQSSQTRPRMTELPKILPSRQKHLLTFAVKRDWCAVVHKLLDILFGLVLACPEQTLMGLGEIFRDEISFLHLAVERKCIPMVKLLLSYVPPQCDGGSGALDDLLQEIWKHGRQFKTVFSPNISGPEGLTPLHIAAVMDGAEGIIDALTSDPNQIGLDAWSNAMDSKGESPLACAVGRGNNSYIKLVRDKIAKRDGSVIVNIALQEKISSTVGGASSTACQTSGICGKTTSSDWTTHSSAVELPVWSTKGLVENSGGGKPFVYPSSCRHVPPTLRGYKKGSSMYKPFWISMLCVAAVCVCACIIMKGPPNAVEKRAFSWGSLGYGYK